MSLRLNAASSKEQAAKAYKAAAAAYGAAAEAYLQAAKDCEEGNDVDVSLLTGNGVAPNGVGCAPPLVSLAQPPVAFTGLPGMTNRGEVPLGAPATVYGFPMGLQGLTSSSGMEYVAVPKSTLDQLMGYQAQSAPGFGAAGTMPGVASPKPSATPLRSPLPGTPQAQAGTFPTMLAPLQMPTPPVPITPMYSARSAGGNAVFGAANPTPTPPVSFPGRPTPPLTYTGLATPMPANSTPRTPMMVNQYDQLVSYGLPSSTVAAIEAAVASAARRDRPHNEVTAPALLAPAVCASPSACSAPALSEPAFAAMRFNGASPLVSEPRSIGYF